MRNKVIIIQEEHPHKNETGSIKINEVGNVIIKTILGKEMVEINLHNCVHGSKSCFVNRDGIRLLS